MKTSAPSASRANKQGPQPQKPAAPRKLARPDALQAPVRVRSGAKFDERSLSSNLPDHLPVLRGESDLVRVYFADLIASVLKDPP
jgi:hypothetical protein